VRTLELYSDGACSNGIGAWAFVAVRWSAQGELRVVDSRTGVEPGATHQRMELTAFSGAVRHALDAREPALIVTDSAYVGDCLLDGWWKTWVSNDWRNAKGRPVAYRDLWDEILGLLGTHAEFLATPAGRAEPRQFDRSPIQVRRVRGHGQGDDPTHDPYRAGNDLADRMAVTELKGASPRSIPD
jgi:ribonuclease HI